MEQVGDANRDDGGLIEKGGGSIEGLRWIRQLKINKHMMLFRENFKWCFFISKRKRGNIKNEK